MAGDLAACAHAHAHAQAPVECKDEDVQRTKTHMRAYLKHEVQLSLQQHAVLKRAQAVAAAETASALSHVHPGSRPRQAPCPASASWTVFLNDGERVELARMQTRHDRDEQALKLKLFLRREAAANEAVDKFVRDLAVHLAKAALAYFEQPAPPDVLAQAVADFHAAVGLRDDVLLCAL